MTYQGFLVDANGVALGNSAPQNYDGGDSANHFLGIEIDAVMSKPIEMMDLLNTVDALLEKARAFDVIGAAPKAV